MFVLNYFKLIFLFIFLSNLVFTDNYQKILDSRKNAITNAIEKVSNVVVGVNVTKIKQQRLNPFFDPFWDDFFPQKRTFSFLQKKRKTIKLKALDQELLFLPMDIL